MLKNDIKKVKEFIKSNDMILTIDYKNDDNYYLKHFCKVLGNSLYNVICEISSIIQGYLIHSFMKKFVYKLLKVKMGDNFYIGPFTVLDPHYPNLVEFGDNCLVSTDVKILTHEISINRLTIGKVKIGDNVIIGAYTIIKPGITIGNNVEIGMGSVIYKDIPDDSIVLGNPARVIKRGDNEKS